MLLPKRAISAAICVLVFLFMIICVANLLNSQLNPLYWVTQALAPPQLQAPLLTHIVLFHFKKGVSQTAIKEVTANMLGLKKACRHPSTRSPYIVSITGGKDNSVEKLQRGMSHAFILQFFSKEDRDYYVNHDPVHLAFKEATAPVVESAQVVDFLDGVFV